MKTRIEKQFDSYKGELYYKAVAYDGVEFMMEFFKDLDEAYQWCADVVTMYEGVAA